MSTVYLVTSDDGIPRGYSPHRDNAERYAAWVSYRHLLDATITEVEEDHARALFEGDSDGGRIEQALR